MWKQIAVGIVFAVGCPLLAAGLWSCQQLSGCGESAVVASPAEAQPQWPSRTVRIRYKAQMEAPAGAHRVRLWVPLPASTSYQEVSDLQIQCSGECSRQIDAKYGNSVLYVERNGHAEAPLEVEVQAVVRRKAYRIIGEPSGAAKALPFEQLSMFLGPNALVPVTGKIQAEAQKPISPGMTQLEKARAFYDYLTRTFSYDRTVEGYGRGDAVFACDVRRGNCSDVHSLFVGMARSQGLAARFVMGFPLPADKREGTVSGYHCWAEFFLPNVGWVPVDISEAIRDPQRHEELFGGLDAHRLQFTMGRDIVLLPEPSPTPRNYLIYPVGMADDTLREDIHWELHFADDVRG